MTPLILWLSKFAGEIGVSDKHAQRNFNSLNSLSP
jgi:hypothetical protein